jgi:vancomycin resistance protein VanJ
MAGRGPELEKSARYLITLGLVAGLAVSLAAFTGGWPGDMLSPFRMQFLVLSLVALGATLMLKQRWLIGLALVVATMNLVPIAWRTLNRPVLPAESPGKPVSLVFSNVLTGNPEHAKVIALVEAEAPDIFAAAETSPEWIEALEALRDRYPYRYGPDLGIFGVAIYAQRPFTAEVFELGARGMVAARADFGDFVLYVAHPMPPANSTLTVDNRVYLDALAARIAAETKPVVLAGDLNATLWSGSLDSLIANRMQWPSGSGMTHTWPEGRPWLAIQIDHVLTKGVKAGRFKVLTAVGSDHLPVRTDLVF